MRNRTTSSRSMSSAWGVSPLRRHGLIALAVAAALSAGLPAAAQAQAADAANVVYELPAQPLDLALSQLARRAGLQLLANNELVKGRQAPALPPTRGLQAALDALLRGSGLLGRVEGNTLLVEKAPAASSAGEAVLPVVRVKAGADRSGTTEGTGSYTTRAMSTATALPLSIRETAQSVSVVTRRQIDDQHLAALNDVIASTPGLAVTTYDSNRTAFKSRGLLISSYRIDGVPQSVPGWAAGEDRYDTAIYDRIEVLRGSAGLLTGMGNPSATINLVRKRASLDRFEGSAELSAGSWNDYRGMIDLQSPLALNGAVRGRLVAAYQDKDSWLDWHHEKKSVLYGTIAFDITPDTLLTINADHQNNDPKGVGWGGVPIWHSDQTLTHFPRSFNVGARWTSYKTQTSSQAATLEHRFNDKWQLRAGYMRSHSTYDPRMVWTEGLPDAVDGSGMNILFSRTTGATNQHAANLSVDGKFDLFGREHDVNIGYDLSRQSIADRGYEANWATSVEIPNYYAWDGLVSEPDWGSSYANTDEKTRLHGLYGVVRLSISDDLKATLGGRQNKYSIDNPWVFPYSQNVFTPYAGLVWSFTKNLSAYASYADIFQQQDNRDRNGNRLLPVRGATVEAGVKGEWFNGKLNAALAIFQMKQRNVAQADDGYVVPNTTPPEQAYVAVDGVRTRGFELEVAGEVRPGWNLGASWAHHGTTGIDDTSAFSNNQPYDVVRVSTNVRVTDRLRLGGSVNWDGHDSSITQDLIKAYVDRKAYAIANLSAHYELTRDLSLQLNVNNVFDKTYYTQRGFYTTQAYGAPRSVMGTLRYRF